MHILIGAIVGAVVSVALTYLASRVINRPLTWKDVAASAMAGIIGGSIATATLGVGAAGTLRTVVAFSAGGATGSAGGQITDNVLHGNAIHKDVGHAVVFGTAIGAGTLGVGKAVAPVARHIGKAVGIGGGSSSASASATGHGNNAFAGAAAGLDDAIVPVYRYVKKALAEDPPEVSSDEERDGDPSTTAARGLEQALSSASPQPEALAPEQRTETDGETPPASPAIPSAPRVNQSLGD